MQTKAVVDLESGPPGKRPYVSKYPQAVYIGVTDRCNAQCIMCWRNFSERSCEDMDDEILQSIKPELNRAAAIGWWSAGEVFAHRDIGRLLDLMESLSSSRHYISTNGMMLKKYASRLADIQLAKIEVSIDGATEETLSRIRVGVHLPDIIEGIEAVKSSFESKLRKLPEFQFNFLSMRSNIHELPLLIELAAQLEVQLVCVSPLQILHPSLQSEEPSAGLVEKYLAQAQVVARRVGVRLIHPQL